MRLFTAAALALVLSSCGSPPALKPDAVLEKLRAGEAPDELRQGQKPEWTAEIGAALAADRPWKSDGDALAAVVYFAEHAGPDRLPIIEGLLTSDRSERRMRGIFIARLSKIDATRDLLEKHAKALLDPANVTVAKVALGALGQRRAVNATESILDYYQETDDPSALRALGRIWEGSGEDARRTAVLYVAHKLTMGPAASPDSTEALLRVMTDAELADFLKQWVPEKFEAREHVIDVAGKKGFDAARGCRIHEAFLKSPDPALVSKILWSSPHDLEAVEVTGLLGDERVAANGARVCDYAAAKLEAMDSGKAPELPADEAARDQLLKKWRTRR